jgi:flagellar basal body-associated protein FliL
MVMATDTSEEVSLEIEEEAEKPAPSGKFQISSKTIKILGLLLVVMVVEAVGIYFVLPPPAGTTGPEKLPTDVPDRVIEVVEVRIDDFNCTNTHANPGGPIYVTFDLVVTVPTKQEEKFRRAATAVHKFRLKQAVDGIIRSSSLDHLGDAELSVIKRKILNEIQKLLSVSYVNEVIISNFRLVEP